MTRRQILLILPVALVVSLPAGAQESKSSQEKGSRDKVTFDFSFNHDPRELYERTIEKIRWRRILGPVGIGRFHIFPAQEPGPYLGAPNRIWGNGFGTSLWRDPITGWPLQ